jgi:hypothetical protein
MPNESEVEDDVIEPGLPAEEQVIRLRKSNKSILSKSAERKTRIAELETENATLKTKYEASEAKYTEAIVGVPLRALAEQISDVPKLWLEQFLQRYKVEAGEDGKPSIVNLDGTPVVVDGAPIAFSANAVWTLVTGGATNYAKDEDSKTFSTITRWQGASGGGANGSMRNSKGSMTGPAQPKKEEKNSEIHFGLR